MDGATFDRLTAGFSRRRLAGMTAAGVAAGLIGTGAPERALAALPNNCQYFAVTGGKNIKEDFNYDDDMKVTLIKQNGEREVLMNDRDKQIGVGNEDVKPLKFRAKIGDELKIVVRDGQGPCYSLEKLFLHCCENRNCRESRGSIRLTRGVKTVCRNNNWRPKVFFRKAWIIE